MRSVIWKFLTLLILMVVIQANAQGLQSENDNITILPEKEIFSAGAGDIIDAAILPVESLNLPTFEEESEISTYKNEAEGTYSREEEADTSSAATDPVVWYDHVIQMNVSYNNSFSSTTTNHYYTFTVSNASKLTPIAWNIPTASNFDIVLFKLDTATNTYNRVSFSALLNASSEQLSYIASPGEYLFEVARTGAVNTSTYNFAVTTQSTYDAQEADDNYWDARIQTKFEQVIGTIDNNFDKDFIKFTTTKEEVVNFSILGGDYIVEIRRADGTLGDTVNSNSLLRATLAPGTWYCVIYSPSQNVNPATTYTFTQQKDIEEITITFDSDEQTDYSKRVNWGAGTYFPIYLTGTISGTAFDADGNPVNGVAIEIRARSSVSSSLDLTYYAPTNASGLFSKTISSPSGMAAGVYYGGALIYHYDVHDVDFRVLDAAGNGYLVPTVVEIDNVSTSTNHNSRIRLNDVAYYTHQ